MGEDMAQPLLRLVLLILFLVLPLHAHTQENA